MQQRNRLCLTGLVSWLACSEGVCRSHLRSITPHLRGVRPHSCTTIWRTPLSERNRLCLSHEYTLCISYRTLHERGVSIDALLSLSRLNHRLPGYETHPKVVQGIAECHHQSMVPLLPQADPALHDADAGWALDSFCAAPGAAPRRGVA
jgi:hypothetical protein